eukprot:gnl/TRDRNA2_/TRDRNA2_90110_c0_seq1.p1 gnl/TRDRNA2_/TRDRNA2_90110_c0~~gnl/TRDRNA2_/TRDRNA2_90110_c0_seq1.p1  ORF type:complete len:210 (-),score=33.78 gnl/TRDRNA2_/TRDRNA2_90110_c0_seq1:108-737(-)
MLLFVALLLVERALGLEHVSVSPRDADRPSDCLTVQASHIKGAGQGLFANCSLRGDVQLHEYCGRRTAERPLDGFYLWQVPVCAEDPDRLRAYNSEADMRDCNPSREIWVDARDETADTCPLRFVNGARTKQEHALINVEPRLRNGRMYYYTTKPVQNGEEFIVDYGENYWIAMKALDKADEIIARYRAERAKDPKLRRIHERLKAQRS